MKRFIYSSLILLIGAFLFMCGIGYVRGFQERDTLLISIGGFFCLWGVFMLINFANRFETGTGRFWARKVTAVLGFLMLAAIAVIYAHPFVALFGK